MREIDAFLKIFTQLLVLIVNIIVFVVWPPAVAHAGMGTVTGNPAIGRYLSGFCDGHGTFHSDRLMGSVPLMVADVVQGPSRRHFRPHIYITDMDRDGVYELVYLKDITNPLHIETRMYRLTTLSEGQARDLLDKKTAGRYYEAVMTTLSDMYRFEYGGTIGNLKPVALDCQRYFSGPPGLREGAVTYRKTLFQAGDRCYILIERLNAPDTRLAVVEAESLERETFRGVGEYIVTAALH